MITNLLCTIAVTLTTNVVEHWPYKQGLDTNSPPVGGLDNLMLGAAHRVEPIYQSVYFEDTNADTKTVEYSVTGRRLLSFEFERQRHNIELTNWTSAHWQVEMRRVRTNAVELLTYTNLLARSDINTSELGGIFIRGNTYFFEHIYPTNWFEPVATNAVSDLTAGSLTNSAYSIER